MPDNSLSRGERLRSLGAVRRLFDQGHSGFVYPFRYVWFAESDSIPSSEVLFSVPKKFHKRANRRNLLRRRTKEAYRLSKQRLLGAEHTAAIDMALIYSTKDVVDYKKIKNAVRKIIEQIAQSL